MISTAAAFFAVLVAVELAALAGRRAWVHWKLGHRAPMVEEAIAVLAEALVAGTTPEPPHGRVARRAYRLAAFELYAELEGPSRVRLTRLAEDLGLVEDAVRTLRRSPRAYARRNAADELAELRSDRAIPALRAALADRDLIVRVASARALASLPSLADVERIKEILDRDAHRAPAAAAGAMLELARTVPGAIADIQVSASSPYVRRVASLALGRMRDHRAMPSLLAELASDNALFASVAVRAMEDIGGPDAIRSLELVAADPARDPALRAQAATSLARVDRPGGHP